MFCILHALQPLFKCQFCKSYGSTAVLYHHCCSFTKLKQAKALVKILSIFAKKNPILQKFGSATKTCLKTCNEVRPKPRKYHKAERVKQGLNRLDLQA